MDQRVRCSVENCHYWAEGNICHASQIMVTSDLVVGSGVDTYESPTSMSMSTTAESSMETCCQTFISKDAPHAHRDRVLYED